MTLLQHARRVMDFAVRRSMEMSNSLDAEILEQELLLQMREVVKECASIAASAGLHDIAKKILNKG